MVNQRLKQLRSENHLTQAQLAEILGIAKTTLAAYEQGKSEPNIELLIKLADYFCVTVDYLIGKTNCSNSDYQPIADSLGIDEKTIETLLLLSATTYKYSKLDYLEAIIQHPQFPGLLNQIHSYIADDTKGWHDIPCLLYTSKKLSYHLLSEMKMHRTNPAYPLQASPSASGLSLIHI